MLMLSRRIGERIYIGDTIRITVSRFKGENKVVIGIDAPEDMQVWREELMESIPPFFKELDGKKNDS